jgi:hypothetical protein
LKAPDVEDFSRTDVELEETYRANVLSAAHRDDPKSGYRFLDDKACAAGMATAERTA